jgi:small-conductance mechanosensitive channel
MVEAYDAAGNAEVFQAYTILLFLVGIGVLLEFVALPLLRRIATRREWFLSEVMLRAVSGQALFWCSFFGLISTLTIVVPSARLVEVARSLLSLLAVLAVTVFLVRLVTNSIRLYFLRHQIGSISLLNNALRAFSATVVIATALAVIGVPIGPLLTILAGSSIGLSLALREPLANIFSGLTILASNKIQPGDYIRLSTGQEGFVTDIRWSDTYIHELTDNLVVVPNALMANTILTNFHRPEPDFTLLFGMGVPYDSDLAEVERLVVLVAQEVLAEVPGGVPAAQPAVRFNAFGETGVRFNVLLRVQSFADQFFLRHEFMKRLGARFAAAGLPSPIPVQLLRVEDVRREA